MILINKKKKERQAASLTGPVGFDRMNLERNNYGHNTTEKNSWRPGGDPSAGETGYTKVWKKEKLNTTT